MGTAVGGLQPALGVLAIAAAAVAVVALLTVPRGAAPLDITAE
ncbi:hypothetical protein [Phytohabitans rumicis]|uniref:Uncharacterized protein n=1 Tax=Phytohabitans rumicis TaxID=1076125 RepID=A0A6V8LDL5_9ACTN|nr:hypothetical protein [Phytohabitans rumicis]GFJ95323.1 hypothetical protein Prum_089650 [Phytohabitans rumicis]